VGALILAKDRPHLAESWSNAIEELAGIVSGSLTMVLVTLLWVRVEIIGLIDRALPVANIRPMLFLQGRLIIVSDWVMTGMVLAFGLTLGCVALRCFSRAWHDRDSSKALTRQRENKPRTRPKNKSNHQESEQHAQPTTDQRPNT